MPLFPSRAGSPVYALALVAFGACTDRPDPTQIPSRLEPNDFIIAGDPPPSPPYISALTLSATAIPLGNNGLLFPQATFTTTLQNPGTSTQPVTLTASVTQGAARRTTSKSVQCGLATSVLPRGTCTEGAWIPASNSASGTGTLVPGGATFEVQMKVGATVVSTNFAAITLFGPPTITAVNLPSDTIVIPRHGSRSYTGPKDDSIPRFTFTIHNPGPPIPTVEVWGILRGARGEELGHPTLKDWCGDPPRLTGTLPTGPCTISAELTATTSSRLLDYIASAFSPAGTLFLELRVGRNQIATRSIPVVLVRAPTIISTGIGAGPDVRDIVPTGKQFDFPPDTLTIGDTLTYTAVLENPEPIRKDVVVRVSLVESTQFHYHRMGTVRVALPSGRSTVSIPVSAVLDPTAPGSIRLERVKIVLFDVIDSDGAMVGTGGARVAQLVSP